jgi:uncharacterized glyoxalase superfamily metalloenzyme YdcJ
MLFREYISKKMQEQWFEKINKSKNCAYYIITHKRKKLGLIDVRDINSEYSESGLFMFNPEYYNSFIPVVASIIMIKTGFHILKTTKKENTIKVLKNNSKALKYNQSLGYYIVNETDNYYKMKITVESYQKSTKKIIKAINNLYGKSYFEFILEPNDFKLGIHKQYLKYEDKLKSHIIKKTEKDNYIKFILDI